MCFHQASNCCHLSTDIQVRNFHLAERTSRPKLNDLACKFDLLGFHNNNFFSRNHTALSLAKQNKNIKTVEQRSPMNKHKESPGGTRFKKLNPPPTTVKRKKSLRREIRTAQFLLDFLILSNTLFKNSVL